MSSCCSEKSDLKIKTAEVHEYGTELAYVRWIDSAIYEGENYTIEDLDGKELDMQSCGIIVKEDPDRITIALDHAPDNGHYRCLLTIPTVAIKFVMRFKV